MAEALRRSPAPARGEAPDTNRPAIAPVSPAVPDKRSRRNKATDQLRGLRRREKVRWVLFAVLPIALIAGCIWYVAGGRTMSTDDAYINAEKVGVATDVSGIVQDVAVKDNEHVAAGQILYRLDPRQFQIALDNAKANLAQTVLMLDSMKQDYKRMLSDAAAQQAQVDLDQTNFDRAAMLLRTGTTTQAVYDQANYTLQNDKNKLAALREQADVQLAKLGGNADTQTTKLPQYLQAKAQVDEAQRELDHTVIRAPFGGTVVGVPAIAPGKYLAASTTAFFLVDTDHIWVDATPKETELTYVHPGQKAVVTVDTYPDVEWHGVVESVSPAAAQEFSLLPAQNTSGNWVKVVQRVPMRIRLDTSDPDLPPLRAGMSVEVEVDTGHARGLPHFLTALFGFSRRAR
ncbi:MAG TPA: HlyD family secretion protein [Xanthobacteraceae bacterium]|nr:HlyD family secretion protein [Xanthobacteraceae bacterium]